MIPGLRVMKLVDIDPLSGSAEIKPAWRFDASLNETNRLKEVMWRRGSAVPSYGKGRHLGIVHDYQNFDGE